jgi:hypothetical protein
MTLRKSILLLTALATIAALAGCNNGSNPPITLTLNTVPTSLPVNGVVTLVASVNNDKANGGVVWSCTTTPAGSPCGTFNPATTSSGGSTTYTAPAILLPAGTTITITATSATNSAISQSSLPITLGPATLANGNYVFSVTGYDYFPDASNYTVSGVISVAGGVITGGEQDFIDGTNQPLQDNIGAGASGCSATTAPLVSCLTIGADGNMQIILVTGDPGLGVNIPASGSVPAVNGVETFSGSVLPLNPGKASIAEIDASATGSGGLELQSATVTAAPGPGSFAFVLSNAGDALAIGGIINIDDLSAASEGVPLCGGTISGAGSIWDGNAGGDIFQGGTFSASCVSSPDGWGRVTFTMNSPNFSQLILAAYPISNSKIQLVETGDSFQGVLGGIAYGQTVPTGGFTAASAQNTYVIGMQGEDGNFLLQSAEQLTINSDGSVTGFLDYADFTAENASPDPVSAPTASAVVDTTGRVSIPGVTDGAAAPLTPVTYNIQLYLDGNGHALAITLDPDDVQGGIGFQQSGASSIAASSFGGPYGMGVTGWDFNADGEFDSVGPVVADGSATFAGFSDVNWLDYFDPGPITVEGNQVSGAFATGAASGIFTGGIGGIDMTNCVAFTPTTEGTCAPDAFNFYLIDQYGDNIAIETDGNQLTFGYIVQQ